MPKDRTKRTSLHAPSARVAKRQFAVQDNAVEHVGIGEAADGSAAEILQSMAEPEPQPHLKKKEKRELKREHLLQKIESSSQPYSKSHMRRVKRKAREEIAGGVADMQLALTALDDTIPVAVRMAKATEDETTMPTEVEAPPKPCARPGQIGEGKGVPLTQKQRKRALETEKLRMPIIRKDPNFASNPFETIRTHAANTLVKQDEA